jgi:predicted nucleic acid-binding Zn ribbon protein
MTQDTHEFLNYLLNRCSELLEKEQKELQYWIILPTTVLIITSILVMTINPGHKWLIHVMTQDAHDFLNYLLNECSELQEKEQKEQHDWVITVLMMINPAQGPWDASQAPCECIT